MFSSEMLEPKHLSCYSWLMIQICPIFPEWYPNRDPGVALATKPRPQKRLKICGRCQKWMPMLGNHIISARQNNVQLKNGPESLRSPAPILWRTSMKGCAQKVIVSPIGDNWLLMESLDVSCLPFLVLINKKNEFIHMGVLTKYLSNLERKVEIQAINWRGNLEVIVGKKAK